MLLPISWLKTFLPKLPPTPKLVETLMMHGLDVEGVISGGKTFDRVVVGEIAAIKPHPNADKLRIAEVVIGGDRSSSARQEIVCGAPNIAVGQKVPVALLGAKLPNGLTIESRAIRGVTSNGMICAEDELGLGRVRGGVLILDSALKVGTPFADTLGRPEEVIDLAIPANRADLMAMRGLAWEIGAMLGQTPKFPIVKISESQSPAKKSVSLKIYDPKLCPLLTARVIRSVTMKPTPTEIVNRLRATGMRSVNIVADIANYVMLEYGQPLHAYDAATVRGGILIARSAKAGEQLKTLDGKTRMLTPEMLVIADAERAIGLAGVMGGGDTEVTETTTDIILEAAIFNPVSIRKTSRQLGLISEASKRFEKGLWASLPAQASATAAAMIIEQCGGTIESGIVEAGKAKRAAKLITFNPKYVNERLGTTVPAAKSKKILTTLGFTVKGTATAWNVTVPDWRIDVALPEDIVDEVGRMVGYEQLPKELPAGKVTPTELPSMIRFKEEVKNILVDMGFTEVISHAFYSETSAQTINGAHFEVANPLDVTQQKLRKSLIPQIEDILQRQADAGHDTSIFEIGYIFDPELPGSVDRQQVWKVALGVTHKGDVILNTKINGFLKRLESQEVPVTAKMVEGIVRGRSIEYYEFDLKVLFSNSKKEFGPWDMGRHITRNIQIREQSKYPAVTRDIAFWWPKDEQTIHETIGTLDINILREFKVKDRFVKDGRTSFALSFVYQSSDRTLTKTEVDAIEKKIKAALQKLGATMR